MQDVGDNLWYPMQHDKVFAQDTAAALEGLDITCTASGMPRAMSSSDLECAQAQQDWQDYDVTEQKGQYHVMSSPPSAMVQQTTIGMATLASLSCTKAVVSCHVMYNPVGCKVLQA